ncbi:MAG: tubulin-like doman-containing protein [Tannerella sp.]|jgi:hypothetical protein|nr:tubulin-like doman-containing protein [Tannerella sp.]
MAQNIFVTGIGGTGMRCIEAFTHLCAIGMFDNTDVHLLALDTDKDNGNFTRLKNLKEAYIKTKGVNKKQFALHDTFFSANLHYYQFSPDYSRLSTFDALYGYGDAKFSNPDKAAIADLLLTDNAKEFDLKHGYRAQTHLGSMLMYHSIINDIKMNDKSDLKRWLQELITASNSGNPRVFILGSVFGGTGASSIPVIPKAIKEAAALISDATDIERNAYFGATLLTSYFSFPLPGDREKATQKVIATSDKFALNSQAAMMFYEADETVKKTYQKFYMMGTEGMEWQPGKVKDKTITGGEAQENDSHYIEMLAAFAAYHFFNSPEEGTDDAQLTGLRDLKLDKRVEYLYRTFDEKGKINFTDFVSGGQKEELAKKLGLFTAMSFLTLLEKYDFFEQAQRGDLKKVKIEGYEDIDAEEIRNLKKYMSLFHFGIDGSRIKDGWLRQVHRSAGGGDKFLLVAGVFSCNSIKEFEKFDFNKDLYQKDSDFESNKFSTGLWGGIYDSFVTKFISINDSESITNKSEKLIKRSYDTLCQLYNFRS